MLYRNDDAPALAELQRTFAHEVERASGRELARAWPEAKYVVVPDAGHSAMEPGIREQLVLATDQMKRL